MRKRNRKIMFLPKVGTDQLAVGASWVGILVMAASLCFIIAEVVARRVFSSPIIFSTEITTFLFMATVAFGAGFAEREGANIRVEIVTSHLSRKTESAFKLGADIVCVVALVGIIYLLSREIAATYSSGQVTMAGLIVWPAQMAMAIGLVICLVYLIWRLVVTIGDYWSTRKKQPTK